MHMTVGSMRASATLAEITITSELESRPVRPRDRVGFDRSLGELGKRMTHSPSTALQLIAEIALGECAAQSAGISILEGVDESAVFRWLGVAGRFASQIGNTMPRNASPCGAVLDSGSRQLMSHPHRHYPAAALLSPRIVEVLMVPLRMDSAIVGTLWVMAHDAERRFEAGDARSMEDLAKFAASARRMAAG